MIELDGGQIIKMGVKILRFSDREDIEDRQEGGFGNLRRFHL